MNPESAKLTSVAWARLHADGVYRGAAVILTRDLAVSAAHCVRGVPEQVWSEDLVADSPTAGDRRFRVIEVSEPFDLALLELDPPFDIEAALPIAAPSRRGDDWYAPARPKQSDPELTGKVVCTLSYECSTGTAVRAVQLKADTSFGEFEGYSGGPVLRLPEDSGDLLGVLFEEYLARDGSDRVTDTLFALATETVFSRFHRLQSGYLIRVLIESRRAGGHRRVPLYSASIPEVPIEGGEVSISEPVEASDMAVVQPLLNYFDSAEVAPSVHGLHQALVAEWALRVQDGPYGY